MKNISLIDLQLRYENEREDLLPIIDKVLLSGNLILSDENTKLENEINEYLGTKYCLTLNSGTDALMIALWALGIKKGDEESLKSGLQISHNIVYYCIQKEKDYLIMRIIKRVKNTVFNTVLKFFLHKSQNTGGMRIS